MKAPNQWDVARAANTMAVVTNIAIDPNKITVRIKNKLIKWLETGYLDGGYRSEARKIGEMLAQKFNLPTTATTWRGLHARITNKQMGRELSELLQADWAAEVLERPHIARSWYAGKYDEALDACERADGVDFHIYLHNKEFRQPMVDVLAKHITDDERAALQLAIDAIKGTEPIHCFTYQ